MGMIYNRHGMQCGWYAMDMMQYAWYAMDMMQYAWYAMDMMQCAWYAMDMMQYAWYAMDMMQCAWYAMDMMQYAWYAMDTIKQLITRHNVKYKMKSLRLRIAGDTWYAMGHDAQCIMICNGHNIQLGIICNGTLYKFYIISNTRSVLITHMSRNLGTDLYLPTTLSPFQYSQRTRSSWSSLSWLLPEGSAAEDRHKIQTWFILN